MAVDPLVVCEHRARHLAQALNAQQQPRAVGRMPLHQAPLGRVQLAAAEEDVVRQRLLADVVHKARGVRDGLLVLGEAGGGGQLARVVGDGGRMPRGARVAQRERLEKQADHPLVADVELVLAPQDLLAVLVALQQRAQQQLADGQREREQPDDPCAVRSNP